jgi:excinuclease ABC subunit A
MVRESDAVIEREEFLEVYGARVHNLKNIDVVFPRNKLVVITGLSGSGKSSLAFDTIYAEGQRRYIESFSAYARNFLGNMERPDVDEIKGLSPVIAIEQKTTNKNPRSTVGTITEIYDFLRLLYARASEAFSYVTGEKMVRFSDEQILNVVLSHYAGKNIILLSPVVKARKGHYRELFDQIIRLGFLRVRIDGEITELKKTMQVDRYKIHNIEIVIDRIAVNDGARERISASIQATMKHGKGSMMVLDAETQELKYFSRHLMCPGSGISYDEPAPNAFSFNSPNGACPKCNGIGMYHEIDINSIVPNPKVSIKKGGILPLGEYKDTWIFKQLEALGKKYDFSLNTPIEDLSEEAMNMILNGSSDTLKVANDSRSSGQFSLAYEGILNFIIRQHSESTSASVKNWARDFMRETICPECQGTRLKKESQYFKVDGKSISELASMDLIQLNNFFDGISHRLTDRQNQIATEIIKEIRTRIQFLLNVGLDYLSLNRNSQSLSGGEAQRIRLATQIGSQLVGVLYILDEPSIGLHQRDNVKLIDTLKNLRDIGNSILVVEHDKEMIMAADFVLDIGPLAGIHGGEVVAKGTPAELLLQKSLTTAYLNGEMNIAIPAVRREGNGKKITLTEASGNNLKNVSVSFPLGKFICMTGVSGSGKSTLINETLYPILNQFFYNSITAPLPYKKVTGLEGIDKVIEIDQSPIGRTPRSNPATYTGVFSDIRNLFASLPESKIRGYASGRFSFNVKGGRCDTCHGAGIRVIEMNFLPDINVPCETCNGKRYNRETLDIRYRGKSINDVLNLSIDHAVAFFENIPSILQKIRTIQEVGLGYITLGQQSTTLSGGEAQRVKLATELAKKDTGNTFYILDEPTTGLHFEDIRILLEVLNKLLVKGNTVLVIEHNLDVIKVADHIIDLGPEGGQRGGNILFEGTPEALIKNKTSSTGLFLKKEMATQQ